MISHLEGDCRQVLSAVRKSLDQLVYLWEPPGMAKERPLWDRMYFEPHMVDLVRMVGYAGLSLEEARVKIKDLIDKHGKGKIVAGSEEMFDTDEKMVRLKAYTRKLAAQMLGFPPEHKETDMIAEIMAAGERLKADPKDNRPVKPNNKPRKRKARTDSPQQQAKRKDQNDENSQKQQDSTPVSSLPQAKSPRALMEQYRVAKERHPGMLLLFRMGDFYELFEEDAETAAKLLGLTLTSREGNAMAGFPHQSLEGYLRKLLQAGKRVAVCDEVKDSLPRGPIRREVTRVLMQAGEPEDVLEVAETLGRAEI